MECKRLRPNLQLPPEAVTVQDVVETATARGQVRAGCAERIARIRRVRVTIIYYKYIPASY